MYRVLSSALVAAVALSLSTGAEEGPKVIADGSTVSIEYTLTLDDGSQADSNVGKAPLTYLQGQQQILPALEQALAGLQVDQSKQVVLSAEDGYGVVNPALFQEVDAEVIPAEARTVGTQLVSRDDQGNQRMLRVHEVNEEKIVLDLNHPLAGQRLHFDVKITAIE